MKDIYFYSWQLEQLKKPTRLMIVRHKITGLLYFCKTVKTGKSFDRYFGSGPRWVRHMKKYGGGKDYVEKLWVSDFFYDTKIVKFAMRFSRFNRIVESKLWANILPENGLDGNGGDKSEYIDYDKVVATKKLNGKTWKQSTQSKDDRSIALTKYWESEQATARKLENYIGSKKEFNDNFIGPPKPFGFIMNNNKIHKCSHCGKIGDIRNMTRWHFKNCKHRLPNV